MNKKTNIIITCIISLSVRAQNVGVGITVPTARLHVVGPTNSTVPILKVEGDGSAIPFLIVTSVGNVGIKVNLPSEALDVSGNVQFSGALMPGGNAGAAGQVLISQGPGVPPQWQSSSAIGDDWGSQVAQTQSPIIGDGTTTNPITVQAGTNAGDLLVWNGSQWVIQQPSAASGVAPICSSPTSNYLQKWTGSTICNSQIFDDGTNVGIGTSSPTHKVHVVGSVRISTVAASSTNNAVVIADNLGVLNRINFTGNVSDVLRGDGTFGPPSGITDHDWYKSGTMTPPSSIGDGIWTNTAVGINVNNPQYTLHIMGKMVAGGSGNVINTNGGFNAIIAGENDTIDGTGGLNAIIGGSGHLIYSTGGQNFIGGGTDNKINVTGGENAIIGGVDNRIDGTGGQNAIIGGTRNNIDVTGGQNAIIGGIDNRIDGTGGTNVVVGGAWNTVFNAGDGHSGIFAGSNNYNSGHWSVILGGDSNILSGGLSVILGGRNNRNSGSWSGILGGRNNRNSGSWSGILGGDSNIVYGDTSVVLCGKGNVIHSDFSVVGGKYMAVSATGTFVWGWSDNLPTSNISSSHSFLIGPYGQFYKVGINILNPNYALTLPNNSSPGVGQAVAQAWNTYSDARIKSKITPIRGALSILDSLKPVYFFQHNSSLSPEGKLLIFDEGSYTYGFIAQELYKVIPEIVTKPEDASEELWTIDYTKLIPILTAAVQELKKQVEIQQQQIESLQRKIAQYESKNLNIKP